MLTLFAMKEAFAENPFVRFAEETVNGRTVTICSYMIADDKFWENPLSEETRGNVFDENGNCICRSFPKFFNVGELQKTQIQNLPWQESLEITEKIDGSIINAVMINRKIFFKSKKSFYSDVAKIANECASEDVRELSEVLIGEYGATPIFELTTPENRIVVRYTNKPPLTLLNARYIGGGEYLPRDLLESLCKYYDVPITPQVNLEFESVNALFDKVKSVDFTGLEGYVFHFRQSNTLVKLKTTWYTSLHHAMTALSERNVAELVINETLDDLKSTLFDKLCQEDIDEILRLEHHVALEFNQIEKDVLNFIEVNQLHKKTFKEVAIEHRNHPLFPLFMRVIRGYTVDYKKYWFQTHYPRYSTKVLLNPSFNKQPIETKVEED